MNKDRITELALANGFKLKAQPDGSMALNPYVFAFARALLDAKEAEIAALKEEEVRIRASSLYSADLCTQGLDTVREQEAEIAALRKQVNMIELCSNMDGLRSLHKAADRYNWLRSQNWNDAPVCVVINPKQAVKLGYDCPTLSRLDDAIDAAMAQVTKREALAQAVQPS